MDQIWNNPKPLSSKGEEEENLNSWEWSNTGTDQDLMLFD